MNATPQPLLAKQPPQPTVDEEMARLLRQLHSLLSLSPTVTVRKKK